MRMINSRKFSEKKILLLDRESKTKNDRTWCFWEANKGFFEDVVYQKWDTISFLSDEYAAAFAITPYQYKMIRGIDFYTYCFKEIAKHDNIEVLYAEIGDWMLHSGASSFELNGKIFNLGNPVVFNSLYKPQVGVPGTIRLLQHFKGWVIKTDKPAFKPEEATMMDFRVHQNHGTTFAYVMPFTSTSALVEYTLFTKDFLKKEQYDEELKNYIHQFLGIENYTVTEEEAGVIPMTNEKFSFQKENSWQIGMAGGQTKASSGYTFQFIQKQSEQIVSQLLSGKPLSAIRPAPGRFGFYDNTLLYILYHDKLPGKKIFTQLFKKNKPQQVLRFLDNETSLKEELKIISTLPTWPFLKAALKQL